MTWSSAGATEPRRDAFGHVLAGRVLAIAVVVLGYLYYQETRSRSGIEIQTDEHGVTMEEK